MYDLIQRFIHCRSGATAIEYALIAALVSIALITGASGMGQQIGNTFGNLRNRLANATSK